MIIIKRVIKLLNMSIKDYLHKEMVIAYIYIYKARIQSPRSLDQLTRKTNKTN